MATKAAVEMYITLGLIWIALLILSAVLYKASDKYSWLTPIANWIGVITILWLVPLILIPQWMMYVK